MKKQIVGPSHLCDPRFAEWIPHSKILRTRFVFGTSHCITQISSLIEYYRAVSTHFKGSVKLNFRPFFTPHINSGAYVGRIVIVDLNPSEIQKRIIAGRSNGKTDYPNG